METLFAFWKSETAFQGLMTCVSKKWLGVLRLAIFLILILVIAFSAQVVHADGETPPAGDEATEAVSPLEGTESGAEVDTDSADDSSDSEISSNDTGSEVEESGDCVDCSADGEEGGESVDEVASYEPSDVDAVDAPVVDSGSAESDFEELANPWNRNL